MHNYIVRAKTAQDRTHVRNEKSMAAPAIQLAICYARDDADDPKKLFQQLRKQLCSLERNELIRIWNDHKILAGTPYADDIESHLNGAGIILLVASASFIASDYCYEKELPRALARHKNGTACVLTVLLHPCYWQDTDLRQFPILPDNRQPISDTEHWPNPDKALLNITEGIRRVAIEAQVMELARLGQKHIWAGEHDQALEICNQALALNEQYRYEVSVSSQTLARLYQSQGTALTHAGYSFPPLSLSLERKQEALEAFEQAVRLDPTLAFSHEQKGTLLYQLGRCEEALPALNEAIRLGEEAIKQGAIVPISPFYTTFQVLHQLKRTDEALAFYLQELRNSFPGLPIHQQAAELFEQAGKYEQALAAHERAYPLPLCGGSPQTRDHTYYQVKARLFACLERYEEALAVLVEWEQNSEVFIQYQAEAQDAAASFYLKKALILELLGCDREALAAFDAVITKQPDSGQAHFGRQRIYERMAWQAEGQARRAEYRGAFRSVHTWKGHNGAVHTIACSPDGQLFASSGGNDLEKHIIKLWDLSSGQMQAQFYGHAREVTSLAFQSDGTLVSGSFDGTIRLWNVANGLEIRRCNCSPSDMVSLAISPDNQQVATSDRSGYISLRNLAGRILRSWPEEDEDLFLASWGNWSQYQPL